jgi:phosphoribosyl 1,2-cyclic phosphodiesterase
MLDCGFALKETVSRLARAGLEASELRGIIVTHEHGDHCDGVFPLARCFGVPVWLTHGTLSALRETNPDKDQGCVLNLVESSRGFEIGDLSVQPFTVPHDAREPVQYVLGDGARRLGVLTDTGCSTRYIESNLSGCNALVVECNHDLDMLMAGPYPPALKARISSRLGHLDNEASGVMLAALDRSRLEHVIAAHLSRTNNTPELARSALAVAMDCEPRWISVATQEEGFGWRHL